METKEKDLKVDLSTRADNRKRGAGLERAGEGRPVGFDAEPPHPREASERLDRVAIARERRDNIVPGRNRAPVDKPVEVRG